MKPVDVFIAICVVLILISLWKGKHREEPIPNFTHIESGCRFDLASNGRYCKYDSMTETVYSRAY